MPLSDFWKGSLATGGVGLLLGASPIQSAALAGVGGLAYREWKNNRRQRTGMSGGRRRSKRLLRRRSKRLSKKRRTIRGGADSDCVGEENMKDYEPIKEGDAIELEWLDDKNNLHKRCFSKDFLREMIRLGQRFNPISTKPFTRDELIRLGVIAPHWEPEEDTPENRRILELEAKQRRNRVIRAKVKDVEEKKLRNEAEKLRNEAAYQQYLENENRFYGGRK